jgi:hypothetical protein
MDPAKASSNSTEADNETPANTPPVFASLTEKTPNDAEAHETNKEKEKESPERNLNGLHQRKMGIFSRVLPWIKRDTTSTGWLIVLLTTVIAATSYLQWHEIRSGSTDTHTLAEAAKTQAGKMTDMSTAADKIREAAQNMVTQDQRIADNAQKALEASNKQSKTALDATIAASHFDQRAWLSAGDNTYTIAESGPIDNTVIVSNTGKSPAMEIFCRINGTVKLRGNILSDSDIAYPSALPTLNQGTIFPNQRFPLKAGAILMESEKQRIWFGNIQSGEWIQYFFGEVRYKDIFGREHWTHFCSQFVPATKGGTPCPIYNDTDDSKRK